MATPPETWNNAWQTRQTYGTVASEEAAWGTIDTTVPTERSPPKHVPMVGDKWYRRFDGRRSNKGRRRR